MSVPDLAPDDDDDEVTCQPRLRASPALFVVVPYLDGAPLLLLNQTISSASFAAGYRLAVGPSLVSSAESAEGLSTRGGRQAHFLF